MNADSPLISPTEVAKTLGISPEKVCAIVRAGHWQCIGACAVKQGGSSRYTYVIPRKGFQRLVDGDLAIVVQTIQTGTASSTASRDFWRGVA